MHRRDYYSVKKRIVAADGHGETTNRAGSERSAMFVELTAPSLVASRQCAFELDNDAGTTLRVQLTGYDAADVAAFPRTLWNPR